MPGTSKVPGILHKEQLRKYCAAAPCEVGNFCVVKGLLTLPPLFSEERGQG